MKILNLIPYSPVPPTFGGRLRVYHLLRWMTHHHDVRVLGYGTPEDALRIEEELGHPAERTSMIPEPRLLSDRWKRLGQLYAFARNTSFTEVTSRIRAMQAALDQALDQESFDLVQIAYPVMGYFDFNTDALRVLDAANVEYDIHRRVAQSTEGFVRKWWAEYEYRKLYPQEISICREQDGIFLTSQRDKELLEPDVPGVPKFVVPNGVDTGYFQFPEGSPEENSLVFTGAINYFPNAEGIEYFIRDIFPLIQQRVPGVRLYVVGNAPPESVRRLASPDIIVTGYVPDVRPYVQRASVYVVPLRIGGGTRLKVLEAMSMRRPIVTTSIGCEGIDVQEGETAFIADDPAAFADATVRLLADRRLRQSMADRGRSFVRERYDWSVVCAKLEDGYAAISRTAMPKGVVNA